MGRSKGFCPQLQKVKVTIIFMKTTLQIEMSNFLKAHKYEL